MSLYSLFTDWQNFKSLVTYCADEGVGKQIRSASDGKRKRNDADSEVRCNNS